MDKYVVEYRGEFSTIIEANTIKEAITKVTEKPYGYQWECIGDLHPDFFKQADIDDYE